MMAFMAKTFNPPQMHMTSSPAVDTLHATPTATDTDNATAITTIETSNVYTSVDGGTPGLLPNPSAEEVPAVHPMSVLNYLNQDIDDQYICNQY